MTNVHYFYDPMCGWCYGATTLIEAIEQNPDFNLILHPGGMIEKSTLPEHFKQHIIKADPRIAELTGAYFGENYVQRLQSSNDFVIDSFLPIKAILVTQSQGGSGFRMLKAIQHAHYVEGIEVYQFEQLKTLAAQLVDDIEKWAQLMCSESGDTLLEKHLQDSHQLMQKHHVSGYPTLIADNGHQLIKLPHDRYYGQLNQWKDYLTSI